MKKFFFTLGIVLMAIFAVEAKTVTFDFKTNDYGLERKSGNASDGYLEEGQQITLDGVTLTFNGSWRLWTDGLREYYKTAGTAFTVSAEGNVTEVSWTVVSGATFALEGTTDNITSWTGDAASVKFVTTATANKAVETITVTYTEGGTVEPTTEVLVSYTDNIGTITYVGKAVGDYKDQRYDNNSVTPDATISFESSYNSGTNYVEIAPAEGGFKAGDVVTLSGYFNNSDETKVARVGFFTTDNQLLFYTEPFINGRTVAGVPPTQTFTLQADADVLRIGRYNLENESATRANILTLEIVRKGGDVVPPVEEPSVDWDVYALYFDTVYFQRNPGAFEDNFVLSNDGSKLYVADRGTSQVMVYDALTGDTIKALTPSATVNSYGGGVAIDAQGYIYATNALISPVPAVIYRWVSDDAEPEEFVTFDGEKYGISGSTRAGYGFDVNIDVNGNGYILYPLCGATTNIMQVIYCPVVNNKCNPEDAQLIDIMKANGGLYERVFIVDDTHFWYDANATTPIYVTIANNDGVVSVVDAVKMNAGTDYLINVQAQGITQFNLGGKTFAVIGTNNHGTAAANGGQNGIMLAEIDVTGETITPEWIRVIANGGGNGKTIGASISDVYVDGDVAYIYAQTPAAGISCIKMYLAKDVKEVIIQETEISVALGRSIELSAIVKPADAKDASISWLSTNVAVATVNVNGRLTTITEGTTVVYAISNENPDIKDSVIVTVYELKPVTIAEAIAAGDKAEVMLGDVYITYNPFNGKELFVADETGALEVFASKGDFDVKDDFLFSVGSVYTGLIGTMSLYNGVWELVPTITAKEWEDGYVGEVEVVPAAYTTKSVEFTNQLVAMSEVVVSIRQEGDYTNIYAKFADETEILVYDRWGIVTLIDNHKYNLEGVMTLFKNEPELYVTVAEDLGEVVEDGVENINGNAVATKVVRDGRVYIIRNGVEYTVLGAVAE